MSESAPAAGPVPFLPMAETWRLLECLEFLGVSQRELARRTGMDQAHVNRLAKLSNIPSWPMACRLADALGIDLETLRRGPGWAAASAEPKKFKKKGAKK